MATKTIQLGSGVVSAGALVSVSSTFEEIINDDIYEDNSQRVTRGLFSSNAASLSTFFTSSAQSASSGQYYYDVYDKVSTDSTREVQFSVAYGHALGSGSLGSTAAGIGFADSPSRAIYAQYQQTLLPSSTTKFNFTGVGEENSIYVINFKRSRLKDKLDRGNWELTLSGSGKQIKLIDDSADVAQVISTEQEYYNVVSGSLSSGVHTLSTTLTYGRVYPQRGVIVLSGTALDVSASMATVTASNSDANNSFKIFSAISRSAAVDSTNNAFKARNEEEVKSTYYFLRVRNSKFNFSNNPSYMTSSADGVVQLMQSTFIGDPKSYITTVGLYNDASELLAVAKISRPILKSYANEILLKVKLDF